MFVGSVGSALAACQILSDMRGGTQGRSLTCVGNAGKSLAASQIWNTRGCTHGRSIFVGGVDEVLAACQILTNIRGHTER